jgi:1-deoxy-D-xylulose 5-phosphate reductoisomerase
MVPLVKRVLDAHQWVAKPTLEEILAADAWAREEAKRCKPSYTTSKRPSM